MTWRAQGLPHLLASAGLAGLAEEPFPTDGWSGATFTSIRRGSERFVLKRTSAGRDWIVRATLDHDIREAVIASAGMSWLGPTGRPGVPYIGAAADGDGAAILMPDLSAELIAWERSSHAGPLSVDDLDRVLDAVARLHAMPWWVGPSWEAPMPWCPLPERILLLARPSAEGYRTMGNTVGDRFLDGWDAFDRQAPGAARDLVERLSADLSPLLDALAGLPSVGLHGDLKLANVALAGPDAILLIDWQMTTYAPVAVELGWLLVSNVDQLPEPPDAILARYRTSVAWHSGRYGAGGVGSMDLARVVGDWEAQVDLAFLVGLLLRGWRKGLDAEAGIRLASSLGAEDDLAWWCRRAVEAAERRL